MISMVVLINQRVLEAVVKGKRVDDAIAASELLEIYNWCKNYNNRPDLMDVSGWSAYCDTLRDRGIGMFDVRPTAEEAPDLEDMRETSHKKLRELEAQRDAEDTEMLCRIVKIRQSLWTQSFHSLTVKAGVSKTPPMWVQIPLEAPNYGK